MHLWPLWNHIMGMGHDRWYEETQKCRMRTKRTCPWSILLEVDSRYSQRSKDIGTQSTTQCPQEPQADPQGIERSQHSCCIPMKTAGVLFLREYRVHHKFSYSGAHGECSSLHLHHITPLPLQLRMARETSYESALSSSPKQVEPVRVEELQCLVNNVHLTLTTQFW